MPADIGEFADRFQDLLERAISARMLRIGVPANMIGIEYWGVDRGAFVRYSPPQLGGNIRGGADRSAGINVDPAVFDDDAPKVGMLPAWRSSSLKHRVDAVIAHEYTEVTAPLGCDFHEYAIEHAEQTELAITDHARLILRQYRESELTMLHYLHVGRFLRDENGIRFERSPDGPFVPIVVEPLTPSELLDLVAEVTGEEWEDFPPEWSCALAPAGYLVSDFSPRNEQELEFLTRLIERHRCMLYETPGVDLSAEHWLKRLQPVMN